MIRSGTTSRTYPALSCIHLVSAFSCPGMYPPPSDPPPGPDPPARAPYFSPKATPSLAKPGGGKDRGGLDAHYTVTATPTPTPAFTRHERGWTFPQGAAKRPRPGVEHRWGGRCGHMSARERKGLLDVCAAALRWGGPSVCKVGGTAVPSWYLIADSSGYAYKSMY